MVEVRFPSNNAEVCPQQLRSMFKEALEYKRDHIAGIQSTPPFNDAEHCRYNTAYSRIFGATAHTGLPINDPKTLALALDDEQLNESERALICELAETHGVRSVSMNTYRVDPTSGENNVSLINHRQFLERPLIAPRLVMHYMANANLSDTPKHKKTALSVVSSGYARACIDANQALGVFKDNAEFIVPLVLQRQMGTNEKLDLSAHVPATEINAKPDLKHTTATAKEAAATHAPNVSSAQQGMAAPTQDAIISQLAEPLSRAGPEQIDLAISDLCKRAITEYSRTNTWAESAQRNARVITDIFITENGDLLMSEITRSHLLKLDARLDLIPVVWGKSREDRQGGLEHVFRRGEEHAAAWAANPKMAELEKIPKVGLSAGTYNRHMKTLKQVVDFVDVLADVDKEQRYTKSHASFARLYRKDARDKNKRKPVPAAEEVRILVSSPIHTGCASASERLVAGSAVIHDGAYWMLLLIVIYGARSNEFCQMPLSGTKVTAPIPYFQIRESSQQRVKTLASNRDLPIAPKLLELGFADYVQALQERGDVWLFPEFNTTNVPASKRFRELVFQPLLEHIFPNGTSNAFPDKEIDTQSFRKFATTFLRQHIPTIGLGIRQSFFGHAKNTTLEGTYEDDHTLEELFPCVLRMQQLIEHLKPSPLKMTPSRLESIKSLTIPR